MTKMKGKGKEIDRSVPLDDVDVEKRPGTRSVRLQISEAIFVHLRDVIGLKRAMGNFYGMADEIILEVVRAMQEGRDVVSLQVKRVKQPKKKKKNKS